MLIRAYAASALPILVKALAGVLLLRVFVDLLGKDGLGQASQFQGVALLVYALLNAVFFNHIAQSNWTGANLAAENNSAGQFRKLLGIVTLSCLAVAILLAGFAQVISMQLFNDHRAVMAIYLLAVTCPLTGLFVAYSARVCADGSLTAYNVTNAIALLLSTLLIYCLIVFYGQLGAFIGFALYYVFPMLFVVLIAFFGRKRFKDLLPSFRSLKEYPSNAILKVGFIGVFSAFNSIAVQLFLRHQLSGSEGWAVVGDWQALTKISESYLLLVTTPLSTFLLPQLSKLEFSNAQNVLVRKSLMLGVAITVCVGISLFVLWDVIVIKIIGESFSALRALLPIQIMGDIFKVISWTFAITAISRMQIKVVFLSEIIFTLFYVIFVLSLIPLFKLQGAIMAYSLAYAVMALFLFASYKLQIKIRN